MNKVEIADRLQTCFRSVVHDVMRDEGLQSFTLPSSITPTKENYKISGQIFTIEGEINNKLSHHESLLAWTGFLSKAPKNKIIIFQQFVTFASGRDVNTDFERGDLYLSHLSLVSFHFVLK